VDWPRTPLALASFVLLSLSNVLSFSLPRCSAGGAVSALWVCRVMLGCAEISTQRTHA